VSGTAPAERFHLPGDAAGRDALAAEYVLGTLDAETAARVLAATQGDAAWRAAVVAWERRLAPLVALSRPESPPPDMWDRIDSRITPYRVHAARGPKLSLLAYAWAIIATLAAAGLGVFLLLPSLGLAPPPAPRLMAPLVTFNDRATPSWLVDLDPRGQLRLTPFRSTTGVRAVPPSGRVLQFWATPPGSATAIDLGVLPRIPAVVTIPLQTLQPIPEMILEISLEPDGGSKLGRPTGSIVFVGRLFEIGAAMP
jgi:anti-sigma-K factor RskA